MKEHYTLTKMDQKFIAIYHVGDISAPGGPVGRSCESFSKDEIATWINDHWEDMAMFHWGIEH